MLQLVWFLLFDGLETVPLCGLFLFVRLTSGACISISISLTGVEQMAMINHKMTV